MNALLIMQGLIPPLQEVITGAHHRFCVMRLLKNFTKQWKNKDIRGMVWECVRSTTEAHFNARMERLKRRNQDACAYLNKFPKGAWTKAYFSEWPKVDSITNNNCGSNMPLQLWHGYKAYQSASITYKYMCALQY